MNANNLQELVESSIPSQEDKVWTSDDFPFILLSGGRFVLLISSCWLQINPEKTADGFMRSILKGNTQNKCSRIKGHLFQTFQPADLVSTQQLQQIID